MVGARLAGRYRLTRLLGQGGMGAVFEAQNADGTATCALKVLNPEFRDDPDVKGRFFDEARAAALLSHPGIVRVFESALAEDGTPFFTMELCAGRSLAEVIAQRTAMAPAEVVALGLATLSALGHAHERGVVHRDLKPENVFYGGDPLHPDVTLLDFGLARVMDAAGGVGRRTRTGMLLGTPGYISPEQLGDARTADARSDLYSVGVMLFELFSGRDPFPAANPFEKLTIMLTAEAPRIADGSPSLAPLDAFFRRALAPEPRLRFPSAREMSAALIASAGPLLAGASAVPGDVSGPATMASARLVATTQLSTLTHDTGGAAPPSVRVVSQRDLERARRRRLLAIVAAVAAALTLLTGAVLLVAHVS